MSEQASGGPAQPPALDAVTVGSRLEALIARLERAEDVAACLAEARSIAEAAPAGTRLRARALYAVGVGEHRARRREKAVAALVDAAEVYQALAPGPDATAVQDALGRVLAAAGRVDAAVHHYAMALAAKAEAGPSAGLATTLVSLGRAQLQAGRVAEAVECFERARGVAEGAGSAGAYVRACALDSLGEALAERGDDAGAEAAHRAAIAACRAGDFAFVEFFSWCSLVRGLAKRGEPGPAREALAAARALEQGRGLRDLAGYLLLAEGRILVAEGAREPAVRALEGAVEAFRATGRPDDEIPARVALAEALESAGRPGEAERCLLDGLPVAHREGLVRHVRALGSALLRLGAPPPAGAEGAAAPDGYLLREVLGAGGFGEVFRAYDPVRGIEVAYKRLRLGRLYDGVRAARLLASARLELEAARRLRHPGVARVYELGQRPDGDAYVVQQLVRGPSLRDRMAAGDGPADPREVCLMLAAVARALAALHAAGVVHRDLKPENVRLDEDGRPVLIDFGIAHLEGFGRGLDPEAVLGTLAYMAPEQARGRRVDARADLYALGVIAYEWLGGQLPVRWDEAAPLEERLRVISLQRPEPLARLRPDLAPEIAQLVHALLEKKPRRRPRGAAAVAQSLEATAAIRP